jgi:ubiquinone/menaquinone biosynthesis C-methylase UbiE
VCSDLSPFYLQQARANMQEWKRLRQPNKRLGGVDDTGVEFRQMAAKRLDAADASVDIVSVVMVASKAIARRDKCMLCTSVSAYSTSDVMRLGYMCLCAFAILALPQVVCVYLFHELPEAVRRKVVAEMYRVLKTRGATLAE